MIIRDVMDAMQGGAWMDLDQVLDSMGLGHFGKVRSNLRSRLAYMALHGMAEMRWDVEECKHYYRVRVQPPEPTPFDRIRGVLSRPMTASEVASLIGMSVNATRSNLSKLRALGEVSATWDRNRIIWEAVA